MNTKKLLMLKSHFHFLDARFLSEFLHGTMFRSGSFLWVSLWSFVLSIFSTIAKFTHRLRADHDDPKRNDTNFGATHSPEDDQAVYRSCTDSKSDGCGEKEKDENGDSVKTDDSVITQSGLNSCENKYQFLSSRDVSGYMEGPQIISFTVEEIFVGSNEGWMSNSQSLQKGVFIDKELVKLVSEKESGCDEVSNHSSDIDDLMVDSWSSADEGFQEHKSATDDSDHQKAEDPVEIVCFEGNLEEESGGDEVSNHSSDIDDLMVDSWSSADEGFQEHKSATDDSDHQKAEDPVEIVCFEGNLEEEDEATLAECEILEDRKRDSWENLMENQNNSCDLVLREDQVSASELKPNSDSSGDLHLANYQAEMMIDGNNFSSDVRADEILLPDTSTTSDQSNPGRTKRNADVGVVNLSTLSSFEGQAIFSIYTEENYADDEYIELDPHMQNSDYPHEEDSSSKDVSKVEDLQELDSIHTEGIEMMDGLRKFEEQSSDKKSWDSDSDDEDESDILQEHRHLVQQMKMEMRYSKVKGLPTISEECETPKSVEDLKPLKIDERFEYKDRMEEIQKFYRSYAEKMRKLDILNYQTLHAISFLQLKDSEVFMAGKKPAISFIKPLIPKFWPYKLQRIYSDSTYKLISETHRHLELVYVGQICLSWEILHWQYAKAKELLEYDSQGCHSYNKVAAEYQQFQVLVERFVEDEPFQGPRIQHYVKDRCIVRSLLQVPMIKDDCLKDKKDRGEEEQDAISVAVLAKIIKESMQVFWEFLSTEKGETKTLLKAGQGTLVDLHDPAVARLLMDIRISLQQKERRLKDILRSRNCIVKKFQKYQRGGESHALFISQVELKLVSRVLNLSRVTTDQLMWCQRKLNNISFVGRKVHVEPSFWLFPC